MATPHNSIPVVNRQKVANIFDERTCALRKREFLSNGGKWNPKRGGLSKECLHPAKSRFYKNTTDTTPAEEGMVAPLVGGDLVLRGAVQDVPADAPIWITHGLAGRAEATLKRCFAQGFDDKLRWADWPLDEAVFNLGLLYNLQGCLQLQDWLDGEMMRAGAALVVRDIQKRTGLRVHVAEVPPFYLEEEGFTKPHQDDWLEADIAVFFLNKGRIHWMAVVVNHLTGRTYYSNSLWTEGADTERCFVQVMTKIRDYYEHCGASKDAAVMVYSNAYVVNSVTQDDSGWSCGLLCLDFVRAYLREGVLDWQKTERYQPGMTEVEYEAAMVAQWITWISQEFVSGATGPLKHRSPNTIGMNEAAKIDKLRPAPTGDELFPRPPAKPPRLGLPDQHHDDNDLVDARGSGASKWLDLYTAIEREVERTGGVFIQPTKKQSWTGWASSRVQVGDEQDRGARRALKVGTRGQQNRYNLRSSPIPP